MSPLSRILAALAALTAPPVAAAQIVSQQFVMVTPMGGGHYSFVQGGFAGGGSISGQFFGADLNNDRQLSSYLGEISGFSASFSGNADIAPWTTSSGVVVFDLDGSGLLGDGQMRGIEGIAVNIFRPRHQPVWVAGPGPFALCTGSNACGQITQGPPAVPEPSLWALLLAGFGIAGAAQRRLRPRPAVRAAG